MTDTEFKRQTVRQLTRIANYLETVQRLAAMIITGVVFGAFVYGIYSLSKLVD